jgi:hypothetical protein
LVAFTAMVHIKGKIYHAHYYYRSPFTSSACKIVDEAKGFYFDIRNSKFDILNFKVPQHIKRKKFA